MKKDINYISNKLQRHFSLFLIIIEKHGEYVRIMTLNVQFISHES